MFRNNPEVLKETLEILTSVYKKSWTITSYFEIKDHAITFTADGFYDPILTLGNLSGKKIIDASITSAGGELDKMTITGSNIEVLRKLRDQWPSYDTVDTVLNKIGYLPAEDKESDNSDIILEGGESGTTISRELWNEYWKCKGKKGPESGWEIPTMAQIYETISQKSKQPIAKFFGSQPSQPITRNAKVADEAIVDKPVAAPGGPSVPSCT